MKLVILGATSGMGQALARQAAQRGDAVFLLGRREEELARCAADLQARCGRPVAGTARCDLAAPETFGPALDAAWNAVGKPDAVVVTAGLFHTQETLESDTDKLRELLTVNFTNTILFCEEARKRLLAAGGGTLCAFSSVAGDRGRKPTFLYGSTKAGLSQYLEGLDHKYRAAGLVSICVKPGFVKTRMTAGLKPPPFSGEPEQVAQHVLRAIDAKKPLIYTPPIWRWVMLVIKHLPRLVMRRIGF